MGTPRSRDPWKPEEQPFGTIWGIQLGRDSDVFDTQKDEGKNINSLIFRTHPRGCSWLVL